MYSASNSKNDLHQWHNVNDLLMESGVHITFRIGFVCLSLHCTLSVTLSIWRNCCHCLVSIYYMHIIFIYLTEFVFMYLCVWLVPLLYSLHRMCDLVPPGNVCNSATYWGLMLGQNPLWALTPLCWEIHWEIQRNTPRNSLRGTLYCRDSVGLWHNPVGRSGFWIYGCCCCKCSALLGDQMDQQQPQNRETSSESRMMRRCAYKIYHQPR